MTKQIIAQFIIFLLTRIRCLKRVRLKKNNKDLEYLINNGYVIIKNVFSEEESRKIVSESGIKEDLSKQIKEPEYVNLSERLKAKIYERLISKKIMKLVFEYLSVGKNKLAVYGESFLVMPNCEYKVGSQLPHHDSKHNRLKVYLWLTKKCYETHPLYYLKGSHHSLKFWRNYEETRYTNINKDMMESIVPEIGDVVLFDTHGIHSHTKEANKNRIVFTNSMDYLGRGGTSKSYAKHLKARTIKSSEINLLATK